MNIAAIETLLTVIQTGNLNKAAERMNVTESTVTSRLDGLENILGQKLLVRSRKGAEMTKAGFAFHANAELIVQSWEQARARTSLPKGFSGIFSLACEFDLWRGLGEVWLESLKESTPDSAFEVWSGGGGEIRNWLRSGMVDAALMIEPLAGSGISSRQFSEDRIVQMATEPRNAVPWDAAYIYVDHGPEFRRQHSEQWAGDNTAYMTISGAEWSLDYLMQHGGSAYLPWRLVEGLNAKGQLHPVDGSPEFRRMCYLSWRDSSAALFPWLNSPTRK